MRLWIMAGAGRLRAAARAGCVATAIAALLATSPLAAAPGEHEPSPQPGSQVLGDGLVVPGQRIGPLRLGMPFDRMIELLGPQFTRQEFKPEKIILYEWRGPGIWISLNTETKAVRVISAFGANTKYHTDKGLTLLMPFSRAEEKYGKSYRRWDFKEEKLFLVRYTAIGLQVAVVDDPGQGMLRGRIFNIGIFRPGDLPPARMP